MLRSLKLLLVGVTAAVAFMALAGTATAASFSISTSPTIRQTTSGKVTFEPNIFGFGAVECEFELRGSIHTGLIPKVETTLIGYLTGIESQPHNCAGGTATILNTFPWHITYGSISGTLPEGITSIGLLLHNSAFLIAGASSCLTVASQIRGNLSVTRIGAGTYRSGTLAIETAGQTYSSITRLSGTFNCPTSPTLKGSFTLTPATITRL